MEVFYNGVWGTVCDDSWDLTDARVVCSSLGYGDAVKVTSTATFGQGSGNIILDNVYCNGSEPSVLKCPHNGFGRHNCGHSEDAGVICINAANYSDDDSLNNGETACSVVE